MAGFSHRSVKARYVYPDGHPHGVFVGVGVGVCEEVGLFEGVPVPVPVPVPEPVSVPVQVQSCSCPRCNGRHHYGRYDDVEFYLSKLIFYLQILIALFVVIIILLLNRS